MTSAEAAILVRGNLVEWEWDDKKRFLCSFLGINPHGKILVVLNGFLLDLSLDKVHLVTNQ